MASVWVVESGAYSEYHVVGVFSSREDAQYVADVMNDSGGDKATVAKWPLDPGVDQRRRGLVMFRVEMRADGSVEMCSRYEGSTLGDSIEISRRSALVPFCLPVGTQDVLDAWVWAKDETHAIKIANEHRARLIATGEWAGRGN